MKKGKRRYKPTDFQVFVYSVTFIIFTLAIAFLAWRVAWGFGLMFLTLNYDPTQVFGSTED